ncbi:FAD binding domain in molybdopterin dehydrogenase family protein [Mycobacterium ulcerans str. Harvey]|uniref:FAD binding domain in molybdopterin dehydrogenase family protein n=1 Tax=Mycobacterium ulcerans str. Harvey TaxID=1299332 RepID=A0ABP3ARK6_MYCUL|nr:FAD binding domain in molybdopterin dehydrogenase family protein [Mycobacterium ulcerans str. Harvey]
MTKLRIANPGYLVDINDLAPELGYLITDPTLVRIGAMARHREILESEALAAVCPIFRDAERVIADPVVRNRGTLGGSLCQADPAEDLSTVCTVLDAVCLAAGPRGSVRSPSTNSRPGPTRPPWPRARCWSRFASRSGTTRPAPTRRWSGGSVIGR